MLNFPIPYPDELLYSTIARAGIRHGITSPKQLLDEIYDNRKVIATLDLPNHLRQVIRWLPEFYDVEAIAYRHTLFPVYAPFIPEERRQRCLLWMAGQSQGAIHLAMGVAASIVKTPACIQYCPACLEEQRNVFGEYFWQRDWQVTGVEGCDKHGRLMNTRISRPQLERHRYYAASPDSCALLHQKPMHKRSLWILKQVKQLLSQGVASSPSYEQWSCYYHSLALQQGFVRGKNQVDHSAIHEVVLAKWSPDFLQHYGLLHSQVHGVEISWLTAMFRKHRKTFSYLQHLIVHEALLESWNISQVVDSVRQIPVRIGLARPNGPEPAERFAPTADQLEWMRLLKTHPPKAARNASPALYARLYRCNRSWLTELNACQQRRRPSDKKQIVDWQQRDQIYESRLRDIIQFLQANRSGPRHSRSFLLKKLGKAPTLEKKLHLLPKTKALLELYSEPIAQYQIRRLDNAHAKLRQEYEIPPSWRLLRSAGLSEDRLTDEAREYLKILEERKDENKRNRG